MTLRERLVKRSPDRVCQGSQIYNLLITCSKPSPLHHCADSSCRPVSKIKRPAPAPHVTSYLIH